MTVKFDPPYLKQQRVDHRYRVVFMQRAVWKDTFGVDSRHCSNDVFRGVVETLNRLKSREMSIINRRETYESVTIDIRNVAIASFRRDLDNFSRLFVELLMKHKVCDMDNKVVERNPESNRERCDSELVQNLRILFESMMVSE